MKSKGITKADRAKVTIKKKDNVVFVEVKMNRKLEEYIEFLLKNHKIVANAI